eukprot:CAMPEP_0196225848 /NCGR_PEP_ID=MMETSP0912-20130531/50091_1 /TAXON_ID=49265 /ORGANISM="Thalassiosira rotula, Strain GSO102" /LENGTH=49 /DNA_ID=CAMNT_0041505329 /DNA_START=375 /DNA_END=524 /DNA_ORIENTATION=+
MSELLDATASASSMARSNTGFSVRPYFAVFVDGDDSVSAMINSSNNPHS